MGKWCQRVNWFNRLHEVALNPPTSQPGSAIFESPGLFKQYIYNVCVFQFSQFLNVFDISCWMRYLPSLNMAWAWADPCYFKAWKQFAFYPDGILKMQLLCSCISTSTWHFMTFHWSSQYSSWQCLPLWQKGCCCLLGGIVLFIAWFYDWLLTCGLVIIWFPKRPYFGVASDYSYKLVFELRNRLIMLVTANIPKEGKDRSTTIIHGDAVWDSCK